MSETVAPRLAIIAQFRHDGILYSVGDLLPELTEAEVNDLLIQRCLAQIGESGEVLHPPALEPISPEAYLMRPDAAVLYALRVHRPSKRTIQKILEVAEMNGRHAVLLEALRLKLEVPVG